MFVFNVYFLEPCMRLCPFQIELFKVAMTCAYVTKFAANPKVESIKCLAKGIIAASPGGM